MSSNANQKPGRDARISDSTVVPVSQMLPFFTAASTPRGMPISAEKNTAHIARFNVMGNLFMTVVVTDTFEFL